MSITAEGNRRIQQKAATASCRLTNQVEGMCSAGHIISQLTLLSNDGLHAIIFPAHVARIVVRLAAAVSNTNVICCQETEQSFPPAHAHYDPPSPGRLRIFQQDPMAERIEECM